MLGADVNAVDNHGSTPLHVISVCLMNSTSKRRISYEELIHSTMTIELSEYDWAYRPFRFEDLNPHLIAELIRMLVFHGGNIHAENSKGHTPLSLVRDPTLKADMVFLTRGPSLHFFEAVCIEDDLICRNSIKRVAANADLGRYIVGFL